MIHLKHQLHDDNKKNERETKTNQISIRKQTSGR